MENLDKALIQIDLNRLNEIVTSAQEVDIDDDIISRYRKAFETLIKRSTDTPRHICVSCERLCYKRNVSKINSLQAQIDIQNWRDLMAHIQQQKINAEYICNYCAEKFRKGFMPAYCILNNLFTDDVPEVISFLNTFEKILIQRTKAFQTVLKMGTKVKGRTFHLPLLLQETLNKLCSTTDSINDNHELYILIRGIPTKSKIIWEEIVNNTLYSHIIMPNDHNDLCLTKLESSKFQMEETENNIEATLDNEPKLLNDKLEKIKNDVELLRTIYPLYEKKTNKTATLYQMLKIHDLSLNNREQYLDLMCFSDLYPFGINGQHEFRQIKLFDHEFIKCHLTFKHPQYRLNQQYLFYLLNDANIRQLSHGIYHKMNITNPRVRYTAAEYLEAVSKESDLNCITQHYGPWLWEDLDEHIREVNEWHDTFLCISVLVRDPVSTARFLDNKFRAMLDFLSCKDHPIGEVTHYFWRREYQGRGIHFHLLIWIKNAPIFGESAIEEVSKFILQHKSCKMPNQNISLLLYRQGRKVIRRCRFGFPRPVTETLNMRDVATSIASRKQLKHKSRLYDLPRTDNEVNINDYNPVLLTAWEDNMNIQFIDEKLSLLTWYITKYMNKGKSEFDTILDKIEALNAESTHIFYPSLIDNYYPHRPNKLENMSLYEFAQWYDISKIKPKNEDIEYYKINNGYYLKRQQNYFSSLLLMFQLWRKLEDLRNECDTYAKSFHKVKLYLVEALKYHEKLKELQKAFETAKDFRMNPENPVGVQYIQADKAMQDFKDFGNKMIREIDVSKMITKLNTDKKRVFDRVINTVNSDDKSILRLYVSGEGGTGKSFLIKTIKCCIKQNLNKNTAVAAPTDIAAFNIDGLTVHKLLQLPIKYGHISKYKQLSDHVLKVLRADFKDVILFVIDEHILLFGDLLQLPPVHENPIFMHLSDEKIAKHLGSLSAILENRKISFKGDSFESRLNELCNFIDNCHQIPFVYCLLVVCAMFSMINRNVKSHLLRVVSNNDDDNNSRTAVLSKQITIKIGAKVMIRRNIDTKILIVQDISIDYVEKIKLLLSSDLEYLIDVCYQKTILLSLSYGITIHKSQGLSLQSAVMDIGNSVFNCGQVYVILSRVTSLKELHFINYEPSSVIASTTWVIHGFQNTDEVSCYANAVLQCLLHLNVIRQQLFNCDISDVLRILMHRYKNGMCNLNTYFNLCSVPTTKVLLAGQFYKTMNAILYHWFMKISYKRYIA
ncbi:hypothetical protein ACFW04_006589 [Cataglyphis niger]